jgi:hypothetical protein
MDKQAIVILGASTILGLSIVSTGLIVTDAGPKVPVNIVEGGAEITGAAKSPFAQALADSGASQVHCKRGVIANKPANAMYCEDGKSAGFLVPSKAADDLVSEAESKLPGLVASDLRVTVETDGKVYVDARGVTASP